MHLLQAKVNLRTSRNGKKPVLDTTATQEIQQAIICSLIQNGHLSNNDKYVIYNTNNDETMNIIWGQEALDIWNQSYIYPTQNLPIERINSEKISRGLSDVLWGNTTGGTIPIGRQDFDFERLMSNLTNEEHFAKKAYQTIRVLSRKSKEFYNLTLSLVINSENKPQWTAKDDTLGIFPEKSLNKPSRKEAVEMA